jgi:hypothetical protein
MEVARLRAQEVAVTELCLPELDPINSQQHPLLKVSHFLEWAVVAAVSRGSTSVASNSNTVEDLDGEDDDDNEQSDENAPASVRFILSV